MTHEHRGAGPRLNKNHLVFLAADHKSVDALEQAAADCLAWQSIDADKVSLNLDEHNKALAATKAARISRAAGNGVVLEFGLRRAQGPDGGLSEARAAYIGGVSSTSNVLARQGHGIPVKGNHAPSSGRAFPGRVTRLCSPCHMFP